MSIFALLSFVTRRNPLYLLVDLEMSTKWVLFGMVSLLLCGPKLLGCTIFCVCGLLLWVIISDQKPWLYSLALTLRTPFVAFVSVPPLIIWVTSFLPELVR